MASPPLSVVPMPPPGHGGSSNMFHFVPSAAQVILARVFLSWFFFVWAICIVGHVRMKRMYSRPPPSIPATHGVSEALPYVSILRPVKGLDPFLQLCLESTTLLRYPKSKYELILCVASPHDPAVPIIRQVIASHPETNARILIGEEDVGPNPKIRNLSKGYREAKGDIMWILDSNIWVPSGILDRSVRLLEGLDQDGKGYKLVHHLPLCVDVSSSYRQPPSAPPSPIISADNSLTPLLPRPIAPSPPKPFWSQWWAMGGGRLEENFLASSHCKFYTAINTLGIAPCVVGKSNLFRRSHLAQVTRDPHGRPEKEGVLAFAEHICEDHLLAERLWLKPVDDEKSKVRVWGRHGTGEDIVLQPVSRMPVVDYLARRTRWLRVRKYTVLAATLLEPGTESLLCSFLGAYAMTTLPFFRNYIPPTWPALVMCWGIATILWAATDYSLFMFLHAYKAIQPDEHTPEFVTGMPKRTFSEWIVQWIGRETLAFGIWAWALWPGEVKWRGGRYKVRWKDCKVEEIGRSIEKKD
ncbi:nucleotide-diphospho-sugar transferase [Tuber brumale]|nr:nucleotide-diphospho-sugar transferase [Tuber brumale]